MGPGPLLLLLLPLLARTAEVWVAVEDRLELVTDPPGPRAALPGIPAKHIIGLSSPDFQPASGPAVYATALDHQGPSVYRIGRTSHLLLARGNDSSSTYFEDISLDPTDSTLYLTSKSSRQILAVSALLPGSDSPRQVLDTGDQEPSGVAVDPCTRRIYWTNSARHRPSIEVCHAAAPTLACSTLLADGLTKPRAIAIDPAARRLFWSDLRRGSYSLEASWLDGTGRRTLASGQQREPFGLAALGPHLYWTDWTTRSVWRVATDGPGTEEPLLVTTFPGSRPHGIAILPAGPALCSTTLLTLAAEGTAVEVPPEVTTVGPVAEETEGACLRHCLAGGACSLASGGAPVCSCPDGRAGPRCEVDLCTNYCLEGGACLVLEGAPECLCPAGLYGDRCQLALQPADPALLPFSRQSLSLAAMGLAATAAALVLAVAGLAVTVARLRRRPRIVRKRFISVPKAETAGGCDGPGAAEDGVTLDIENCCNMTLCDTPCFEPPTRGPGRGRSKGRGRERMDRRSLLAGQDSDCPDF